MIPNRNRPFVVNPVSLELIKQNEKKKEGINYDHLMRSKQS